MKKIKNKSWRDLEQVRNKKLFPETIIHTLFERTLVFIWNSAPRENFNFLFYIWISHVVNIISDWAANAFQVCKNSNQVIPLKLRRMVFTVFTKDNIDKNSKSNEAFPWHKHMRFSNNEIRRWRNFKRF